MRRKLTHVHSHTFREKSYEIHWRRLHRRHGLCDPPSWPAKRLYIDPALDEDEFLQTAIHEALHACYWDLDEDAIDDGARDLSKFLRRIGFRYDALARNLKRS